jgi:hypothetical protein
VNETPFLTLLYRYFFMGWLFRPVPAGSASERATVARHNRRQARWLPTYMGRWLGLGLLFYAGGAGAETMLDLPDTGRWLYALSAMGVAYTVTIATAWVGLTQNDDA